jgi:hypothetical protein
LLLCLIFSASPSPAQEKEQVPGEFGLQAIYLYNFLQFVHWPADKCPALQNGAPKEITVIGDSPLNQSLQTLKDELQRTQGTEITIRFLGPYVEELDLSNCGLLFISHSEIKNLKKILNRVKNQPLLTVSDSEECLEQGCMIALLSRMNKVRWGVNLESAEAAGLRLSSRLLTMAVKVID